MGDRYFLTVKCPQADCGYVEHEVYYAPTCGFVEWHCPKCKTIVDLEKETGITYEDASNRDEIEQIVKDIQDQGGNLEEYDQ